MSENNEFLPFLINEDIYIIDTIAEESISEVASNSEGNMVATVNNEEDEQIKLSEPVQEYQPLHDILIIFDNPNSKSLPEDEREYLGKILGAIGKSVDKVDFQNVAATTPNGSGYKQIISFTPNHQLPVAASTQMYISTKLGEGILIVADSLKNISTSTELRKKLWGVLQEVFK